MLGLVVVALGGLFVLIGANGLVAAGGRDRPRRALPGSEWGTRPASARARRVAAAAWLSLGLFFVAAAFAHLPPL